MNLELFLASVVELIRDHLALAVPLAFVLAFAEGIPGLSLLVPSSVIFLGVGSIYSASGGVFWHIWLAAGLGAVIGDGVTYALGRWLKNDIARLPFFGARPEVIVRAHRMFERWGVLAVIGGKFLGFLRPFIPAVAGIVGMPWPVFALASFVSSLAWAAAFLAPGYGLNELMQWSR